MSEKIVQLNEEVIKGQLKELVRGSVEETLNELLEKEAESLTQAARYEHSEARQGYRSGHYDRNLTTTSGDVTLHVPRLKGVSFETAIIERYRRRESSVEEALIEMYLAGVSVRRVEDITEALWGSKVSPATISELNKKAYVRIEDWRNRPLPTGPDLCAKLSWKEKGHEYPQAHRLHRHVCRAGHAYGSAVAANRVVLRNWSAGQRQERKRRGCRGVGIPASGLSRSRGLFSPQSAPYAGVLHSLQGIP